MASSALSASMVATNSTSIASAFDVKKGLLKASVGSLAGKPAARQPLAISNGSRVSCMLVWPPIDNPKFETLSYLPPLSEEQIAKQVSYITSQGFIPCLEFDRRGGVYRDNFRGSGYYDGRYWTMWKLPMFGCTDSSAVLREISECQKSYPDSYIRVLGFDNKRQVQVVSFLVKKPSNSSSNNNNA